MAIVWACTPWAASIKSKNAFARGKGTGDLVREVDMARRVDQVETVVLAVFGVVGKGDRLALDGDPPLPLDVHVVEDLILEVSGVDDTGVLNQPVSQGRLAVINMSDDTEIPYVLHTNNLDIFVISRSGFNGIRGALQEVTTVFIINHFFLKISL